MIYNVTSIVHIMKWSDIVRHRSAAAKAAAAAEVVRKYAFVLVVYAFVLAYIYNMLLSFWTKEYYI